MYKVLIDYGSEGYKFDDKEFLSVEEAVKHAVTSRYYSPFLIVKVIDWKGIEITK